MDITADSASIQLDKPPPYRSARDAEVMRRYVEWFAKREPSYLAISSNAIVYSMVEPAWLQTTKKRISRSVAPDGSDENDGRWLCQEVADAAIDFFNMTADLLPGEPFIYSSREGDLVAEFKADRGTLTTVVAPTFAVLFAVVDGKPIERAVSDMTQVRQEVEALTEHLRI